MSPSSKTGRKVDSINFLLQGRSVCLNEVSYLDVLVSLLGPIRSVVQSISWSALCFMKHRYVVQTLCRATHQRPGQVVPLKVWLVSVFFYNVITLWGPIGPTSVAQLHQKQTYMKAWRMCWKLNGDILAITLSIPPWRKPDCRLHNKTIPYVLRAHSDWSMFTAAFPTKH